ncbi:MAG: hypothetical protein ABI886_17085, partial [Betaproteobacteria bacterium]
MHPVTAARRACCNRSRTRATMGDNAGWTRRHQAARSSAEPMPDLPDFDPLALLPAYDDDHPPPPDAARALLDECFARFRRELIDAARSSLETTDDLFEG